MSNAWVAMLLAKALLSRDRRTVVGTPLSPSSVQRDYFSSVFCSGNASKAQLTPFVRALLTTKGQKANGPAQSAS